MALRNRSTIPSGMLNPSGIAQGHVDPNVQATTRPAGHLLAPSPGYDTIRRGKNRMQGRGPTGGFRQQEFAEDVGSGMGAALSIVPGDTTSIEASEWLPENLDSIPEGSIIIADRKHEPGFARFLHEAYNTIPDLGDRTPERPRSMNAWFSNPVGLWRKDYRQHPAATVAGTIGLLWLINIVAREVEGSVRGYSPRSVGQAVTGPPADAAGAAGDVAKQVSNEAENAVKAIGGAADAAVNKIESATDSAVRKIENVAS